MCRSQPPQVSHLTGHSPSQDRVAQADNVSVLCHMEAEREDNVSVLCLMECIRNRTEMASDFNALLQSVVPKVNSVPPGQPLGSGLTPALHEAQASSSSPPPPSE